MDDRGTHPCCVAPLQDLYKGKIGVDAEEAHHVSSVSSPQYLAPHASHAYGLSVHKQSLRSCVLGRHDHWAACLQVLHKMPQDGRRKNRMGQRQAKGRCAERMCIVWCS